MIDTACSTDGRIPGIIGGVDADEVLANLGELRCVPPDGARAHDCI